MLKCLAEVIDVLKKFLAAMICLLIISAQASAMRLELYPQPVGKIFFSGDAYQIEGATKIKGSSSKGVAMFCDKIYPRTEANKKRYGTSGGDELYGEKFYFHFDAAKKICSFGDKSKKNSVPVDIYGDTEFFLVSNSAGHDLFLIKQESNSGDAIKVIGQRDGKWIEQLDALSLRKQYDIGWNFHMSEFFTEENRIIFRYTLQDHFIDVICRYHAVDEKFHTESIEQ